jgi:DNA-binding LacI/PurR family transcriptional regulator
MKGRATIKDVARRAGTSTTTVSFVLNKRPGKSISRKVIDRVLKAASDLAYRPSAAAAGLPRKRTRNLGLLFYKDQHTLSNVFYSQVIEGLIKETLDQNYNILFSYIESQYQDPSDLPRAILEQNVDGVICTRLVDRRMLADIRSRGIPLVGINNHPRVVGLDSVQIDNNRGGRLAAEHLLSLGHRYLGVVGANFDGSSIPQRCKAFARVAEQGGAQVEWFQGRRLSTPAAVELGHKVLKLRRRPTALFCANDEMAFGILTACHELQVRVPDDISVVGFDNLGTTYATEPPLTTVHVAREEIGRLAVRRLIELVSGDEKRGKIVLSDVHLVVRKSTGLPRTGRAPSEAKVAKKKPQPDPA